MSDNDSFRIELPDFQDFVKTVVECVNLGYTHLHMTSDNYPDTFGGFMYSCTLSRPKVENTQGNSTQNDLNAPAAQPKQEVLAKQPGRPKGGGNPRYDRGLKFSTGTNNNP